MILCHHFTALQSVYCIAMTILVGRPIWQFKESAEQLETFPQGNQAIFAGFENLCILFPAMLLNRCIPQMVFGKVCPGKFIPAACKIQQFRDLMQVGWSLIWTAWFARLIQFSARYEGMDHSNGQPGLAGSRLRQLWRSSEKADKPLPDPATGRGYPFPMFCAQSSELLQVEHIC